MLFRSHLPVIINSLTKEHATSPAYLSLASDDLIVRSVSNAVRNHHLVSHLFSFIASQLSRDVIHMNSVLLIHVV